MFRWSFESWIFFERNESVVELTVVQWYLAIFFSNNMQYCIWNSWRCYAAFDTEDKRLCAVSNPTNNSHTNSKSDHLNELSLVKLPTTRFSRTLNSAWFQSFAHKRFWVLVYTWIPVLFFLKKKSNLHGHLFFLLLEYIGKIHIFVFRSHVPSGSMFWITCSKTYSITNSKSLTFFESQKS